MKKRTRWTIRVNGKENAWMTGRPSDRAVEHWIEQESPPVEGYYVVTLCYDGRPKAAWDVTVSMEAT